MSEINGTLMDLSDDNSTSSENWPNASMYYSLPIIDPEFQDCKPTILKTEITVSLQFRIIITQERPLVTRSFFCFFTNWVSERLADEEQKQLPRLFVQNCQKRGTNKKFSKE